MAKTNPKKITRVEGITEYQYDNGLRLLLFPDPSKPQVTVNITYFVGSRLEGRGESGMAHLLEHMLFKGTPTHTEIWKLLQDHGAQFNGTTWLDRTNYYETMPSSDPANLEFALKLEADRMLNSRVRKEDLETEMTVVRNEFEMGENNPIGILAERMMSAAYLWHNYGKSTIGSRSDIERVPIENLRAFYKKYYRPSNAMLVLAGDFKEEKALELVQKYFAVLKNPEAPLDDTYTLEPVQDGPRHVELKRVGDVAATGCVYHICAGSHADFPAIQVLSNVLTDKPSGRLYKALVESGMAANVWGEPYGLREPGTIQFMSTVASGKEPGPVLETMKTILEEIEKSPITKEETDRSKNRILKDIELSLKDSGSIGIQLTEWAAAGDWRLFFLNRDQIESLTPEDLTRVAQHYLKESNRTSGTFIPTKDPVRAAIPETPNVPALVKTYKGKDEVTQGESFEPIPEKIEPRVRRAALSSGMKLALLPKKTRGEAVQATFTIRFGSLKEIQDRGAAIFSMIPGMMLRGTKKRNYQQIRDELDRLKTTLSFSSGGGFPALPGSLSAAFETNRKNLSEVLDLIGEIVQQSVFPNEEFEVVKKEALTGLEQQLSDPQTLGFLSLFRRLSPWPSQDPRYLPTIPESIARIQSVKAADLRKAYAELIGANHMQFAVVGDFDEKETKAKIEKVFGNWKSPKPFQRIESPFKGALPPGEEMLQTPDKQMAIVGAVLNLEIRDDDPDYPALQMANYIFGASPNSKLMNRLRQKEGLSYGAFSMFHTNSIDRNGFFGAGAICAPQNADKAMSSMLDEFKKFATEKLSASELKEAKDSFALQTQNRFSDDQTIAGILNGGLYLRRTLEYHKNLYAQIAALKPDQIQSAFKKFIDSTKLIRVKAGDLKEVVKQ